MAGVDLLLSAAGVGTNASCARPASPRPVFWRWQERFAVEGVDGLLRDKTRPSRSRSSILRRPARRRVDHGGAAARSVALDQRGDGRGGRHQREFGAAHLARARAPAASCAAVQALQGPAFVGKLRDIVGLYVDPPAHAVVLSVDEKSQIQGLDRTQPGLPLKKAAPDHDP